MSVLDALGDGLVRYGVPTAAALQLAAYGELVLRANRTMNLTAAREPQAIAEHILDSLTLAPDVDGPLIDIGSGAGFPGIPLAIATGWPVTLVEAVRKKAVFLASALRELDVRGEVKDRRAESLGREPDLREQFACATARAVAVAPTVAELTIPFLRVGGRALLQRGFLDARERQALVDAALMLGAELVEERLLGEVRRVLVVEKRRPTEVRFPRREGIPEKRPLCL